MQNGTDAAQTVYAIALTRSRRLVGPAVRP